MQNGQRRAFRNRTRWASWGACLAVALCAAPAVAQPPTLPAAVAALSEPMQAGRLDVSVLAGPLAVTDWSDTVVLGSVGPTGSFRR